MLQASSVRKPDRQISGCLALPLAQKHWSANLFLLFFAAVACGEDAVPATSLKAASTRVTIIDNPDVAAWNRFEAQVDIAIHGPGAGINKAITASRGVSVLISKRRDAVGRWVSDYDIGDYLPRTSIIPTKDPPRIARVVGANRASAPVLYDITGSHSNITPPTLEQPAGDSRVRPRATPLPALERPNPNARAPLLQADTSIEWIDRYIVTPAGSARTLTRLQQQANRRELGVNGRSRFTHQRGELSSEILFNDSTGFVEELRVTERGQPRSITERRYSQQPNGVYVLSSERIRTFKENGGDVQHTMILTYKNIRILEDR